MTESRRFGIRVRGELACFTRPELKVERVSYEVMTPSAARGVLEAVLWKPAITWRIHEIAVLTPIRWISFRRNEVNSRASIRTQGHYLADEDRAQRNTVALRDVDYVVSASFEMTSRAGPDDNVRKFEEMFERRLERGQYHHAPYLGCREFAARVDLAPETFQPSEVGIERPLGWMFFDFDFPASTAAPTTPTPLFFEARLKHGVLQVPPRSVVRSLGGGA